MKLLNTEKELIDIARTHNIYIYGAGACATALIGRLKRYEISYEKIITSSGVGEVNDSHVYSIDEISDELRNDNSLIIVATTEKYHEDINKAIGESNVVFISDRLYSIMNRINGMHFQFMTHIVEHCNLKCRGCYHFSSLAKEEYLDPEEYKRDINQLSHLFNGKVDQIILLGGEPLLHPQIATFFEITRAAFSSTIVKVLTNGLKLLTMDEYFWKSLADNSIELWVTKYPVNFDYEQAEKVALSHGITLHYFNTEPVRTLGYQPLCLSGENDYVSNFNKCYRANNCIDLKHGKIFPCLIPAEIKPFNEYFNQNLEISERDYVDIYSVKSGLELLELLEQPIPFCRYCNRENIQIFGKIPWSQTKYDISEWAD